MMRAFGGVGLLVLNGVSHGKGYADTPTLLRTEKFWLIFEELRGDDISLSVVASAKTCSCRLQGLAHRVAKTS